jgi:hypothetical protein
MSDTKMKLVLRYLNKQNVTTATGSFSVEDVNVFVSQWLNKGYVLKNTHYVGENPDGYGVLFVLVKE